MTIRTWSTMLAWSSMKSCTLLGVATICILIGQRPANGFDDGDTVVVAATTTAPEAPAEGASSADKTAEKAVESKTAEKTVDSAVVVADKTAEKTKDSVRARANTELAERLFAGDEAGERRKEIDAHSFFLRGRPAAKRSG